MKTIKYTEENIGGKQVYPWYNLKQNISWHNVTTYPMGILWGIITFEWLRPKCRFMIWRLKPWGIWMPPKWSKDQKNLALERNRK